MQEHDIKPIDVVIGNLYPFASAASAPDATSNLDETAEYIDIGGPAMLRAAAKSFASVFVITDPADYARVTNHLEQSSCASFLLVDHATNFRFGSSHGRFSVLRNCVVLLFPGAVRMWLLRATCFAVSLLGKPSLTPPCMTASSLNTCTRHLMQTCRPASPSHSSSPAA